MGTWCGGRGAAAANEPGSISSTLRGELRLIPAAEIRFINWQPYMKAEGRCGFLKLLGVVEK